jgi:general secretion pathway protein H
MTRFDKAVAQDSEAGFSLIEMLAVLTILALGVSFAMPFLSGKSDGLRLEMASSELAGALRATRSAAIVGNKTTTLLIDVDRRSFESTAVLQRSFAPDIEAKMTFASGIRSAFSEGGFRFFPDGSSTGGNVTLSLHGKQTRLCVDWLTGGVHQEASC